MLKKSKPVQVSMRVDLPFEPTDEQVLDLQRRFATVLVRIHKEREAYRQRHLIELPDNAGSDNRVNPERSEP